MTTKPTSQQLDFGNLAVIADEIEAGTNLKVGGNTISATEIGFTDGVTAGTAAASKALVLGASKEISVITTAGITNVDVGASGTAGTLDVFPATASKGKIAITAADNTSNDTITIVNAEFGQAATLTIPDPDTSAASFVLTEVAQTINGVKTFANIVASDIAMTVSSASTDGGTSVEPFNLDTTMTGIGGVGGRAKFTLTTNVALGGWSNALKAQVSYGAAGKTTGLGSAFVAEMTLSAGTADGTYAPVEIELNMGSAGVCGTATSLIYASVNDAAATTFDTDGFILNLAGLTAGASSVFRTGLTAATINAATTAALRIKIGATTYYIPVATATA